MRLLQALCLLLGSDWGARVVQGPAKPTVAEGVRILWIIVMLKPVTPR